MRPDDFRSAAWVDPVLGFGVMNDDVAPCDDVLSLAAGLGRDLRCARSLVFLAFSAGAMQIERDCSYRADNGCCGRE